MQRDFIPSELIAEGLAYTVMGICIVFLILIIIMFVIKAMALISSPEKKETAPAPAPAAVMEEPVQEDSLGLIAVITAAVAASMGKSASSIQVKSYKKIDGGAWNKAGRREVLENRF